MDGAAQFFYVSAGVGVWVGVVVLLILGILLTRMFMKFNSVADSVKQTVDDVQRLKNNMGEMVGGFVSGLLDTKRKKGGVRRGKRK